MHDRDPPLRRPRPGAPAGRMRRAGAAPAQAARRSRVKVDHAYAWSLFESFVAADTSVRPMHTFVPPDDPRVAHFAHEVAAPVLSALGARVEVDRLNNVVARFGPATGREVLLVSYSVTHHANRMRDP